MRIIIEIEDGRVATATVRYPEAADDFTSAPCGCTDSASQTPPPELLAAAAAIGAADAGPAPPQFGAWGAPGSPPVEPAVAVTAAVASVDAGPARLSPTVAGEAALGAAGSGEVEDAGAAPVPQPAPTKPGKPPRRKAK